MKNITEKKKPATKDPSLGSLLLTQTLLRTARKDNDKALERRMKRRLKGWGKPEQQDR